MLYHKKLLQRPDLKVKLNAVKMWNSNLVEKTFLLCRMEVKWALILMNC